MQNDENKRLQAVQLAKSVGADPGWYDHFWSVMRHHPEKTWPRIVANLAKFQPGWFRK
jgi:hypothetical protein